MPKIRIDEADELTVADIIHAKFTALPATATIADVRDWFAASTSRRQAFVADDGRYVGSAATSTRPAPPPTSHRPDGRSPPPRRRPRAATSRC
jgi:hypothetical protein